MSSGKKSARGRLTGKQWIVMVGVLCLLFMAPTFSGVSVTLAAMTEVYPTVGEAAISYITNVATPAAMVAGLLCGLLVGRKVKFKHGAVLACALVVLSGIIPVAWPTLPFEMLIFDRIIGGLGIGMFNPIANSIMVKMFKTESARSAWIGFGSVFFSLGVTASSTVCGILALSGWQWAYSFYLIAVIPLIIFVFLFKDKYIESEEEQTEEAQRERAKLSVKLPGKVWGLFIVFMFFLVTTQMFFNYGAISLTEMGVNPAVVGTVFSVFSIGGIVIGALNVGIWKGLHQWQPPVMTLCMTLCYVFVLISVNTGSVMLFYVAAFVGGVGCCSAGLSFPVMLGCAVDPAKLTMAVSFCEIFRNLGGFISTPFSQMVYAIVGPTATPTHVYIATMILSVVVAAAFFLVCKQFKPDIDKVRAKEREDHDAEVAEAA